MVNGRGFIGRPARGAWAPGTLTVGGPGFSIPAVGSRRLFPLSSGSPCLGTVTEEETETEVREGLSRLWNVIVHDDPVTLMTYVTRVFMRVFGYPIGKAHRLMMEVHTTGRSVVWTGDRERAEGYVLTLHGYHLLATLDPVDG
jgi:ATP-dependent Clp protease adaptor protein ClpS